MALRSMRSGIEIQVGGRKNQSLASRQGRLPENRAPDRARAARSASGGRSALLDRDGDSGPGVMPLTYTRPFSRRTVAAGRLNRQTVGCHETQTRARSRATRRKPPYRDRPACRAAARWRIPESPRQAACSPARTCMRRSGWSIGCRGTVTAPAASLTCTRKSFRSGSG